MSESNDSDLDKMMEGMSSSESDFSDEDVASIEGGSPTSHTASAEKDFMRKLKEQRSDLSWSEGKDNDNSENEDSINFDNDASDVYVPKKLPTTTPSTSPINDSKYDDSDDEGMGNAQGISNMVIMKEDYNDYDDAGDSTSEDEGEFEGDGVDSDDSEFDYNIPSCPVPQRSLAMQQQQQQQQQQEPARQSFTSFNSPSSSSAPSFNPYLNTGAYGAPAVSYDTQVTSFGFRGATSASIDRTTDSHLANQARDTKMSFAEAKAPPPSPCTAPSKELDGRPVPDITHLNLGGASNIDE
ncbi:hypothetical protein TrRE_jg7441, partial [Triparma retinervis]